MSEFVTKQGSTAEQLEELESARGLIETGGVRSMAVVCVMKSGELSRISSCAPEDWLGLRGGLMTAALGLDGEEVRDGLPEVVIDEEQEETEAAQVAWIGPTERWRLSQEGSGVRLKGQIRDAWHRRHGDSGGTWLRILIERLKCVRASERTAQKGRR